MAKKKKQVSFSARENVWQLYQTRTISEIAKLLKVDRRTVQRWKNQDRKPSDKLEKKLTRAASREREERQAYNKQSGEDFKLPNVPVLPFGKRRFLKDKLSEKEFKERERVHKKIPKRERSRDRFVKETVKDKRGKKKTEYYRMVDSRSVRFDVRRMTEGEIATFLWGLRGQERSFVILHKLPPGTPDYDGQIYKKTVQKASRPEFVDGFKSIESLLDWIEHHSNIGQILYLLVSDSGKRYKKRKRK